MTKLEIEQLARDRYNTDATVVACQLRHFGEVQEWCGLKIVGEILGYRRSLDELVPLIERGPLVQAVR